MTGKYRHISVLLKESIASLDLKKGSTFVDATLGYAGHSALAAQYLGADGFLIGIDQDSEALAFANERLECSESLDANERPKINLVKGNFGELDDILVSCCIPGIDAILFDLGMSSPQIDTPERGFSFKSDAPLDMRMDPGKQTLTAEEIINTYNEADLAWIIRNNSDERWAARIAKFIVDARKREHITRSGQLVDIVKAAIPASARRSGGHPAKRTFQALRMEANDETGVLKRGLDSAIRWLNPGGVICVISYHSIEDRIVKETFQSFIDRCTCPPDLPVCACEKNPLLKLVTKKPIVASNEEVEENPRARSAKMRVARKL